MMNYNYAQLFANQFDFIDNNPDNLKSPTRSSKVITPMHSAIAKQIQENSEYSTISLADGEEYTFEGIYGSKKVDIAVFDKNGKLWITASGDKNFIYDQISLDTTWIIEHNLNKYPSVSTKDSGGNTIIGEVEYLGPNKLSIHFSVAVSGRAYLN